MYSGIAPVFLSQLENTKDKDYIQIVVWCLGNLCGDEKCRNILLSSRLVTIVIGILNKVRDEWWMNGSTSSTRRSWRAASSVCAMRFRQ